MIESIVKILCMVLFLGASLVAAYFLCSAFPNWIGFLGSIVIGALANESYHRVVG